MALTSCVGCLRAAPAFHCKRDSLYSAWRRSLTASVHPSKQGLGFPKRCKWYHLRKRLREGLVTFETG